MDVLKGHVLVLWGGTGTRMWVGVTGAGTMAKVLCIRTGCRLNWLPGLVNSLGHWFGIRKEERLPTSFWAVGLFGPGCIFIDHPNVVLPKKVEVFHNTHAAHGLKREQGKSYQS